MLPSTAKPPLPIRISLYRFTFEGHEVPCLYFYLQASAKMSNQKRYIPQALGPLDNFMCSWAKGKAPWRSTAFWTLYVLAMWWVLLSLIRWAQAWSMKMKFDMLEYSIDNMWRKWHALWYYMALASYYSRPGRNIEKTHEICRVSGIGDIAPQLLSARSLRTRLLRSWSIAANRCTCTSWNGSQALLRWLSWKPWSMRGF